MKRLVILFMILYHSTQGTDVIRSFHFDVQVRYAKLHSNAANTQIQNTWPRMDLKKQLPEYLSVAVMVDHEISDHEYILMGRPIHCVQGDILDLTLENNLDSTGLSLHFHGFEMEASMQYDGVVGLTQCPISPRTSFAYKFVVNESAGTYWYHTHSGNLGVESHNIIKAPLIVHPNTEESKLLVNALNDPLLTSQRPGYNGLLSYGNERILFFSDGFLKSENMMEMYTIGGLNPPVHENEDGFIAANMEHDFGVLNGKLREIIYVVAGETYKFRLINGGSHFAYRISIDGFPMKIVATDSTPTKFDPEMSVVDEVILHNAERFDVEITIPVTAVSGTRVWIRADTLESRKQGFENGIRGILYITENISMVEITEEVEDPEDSIRQAPTSPEERKTMNCYSKMEIDYSIRMKRGGCYPIERLQANVDDSASTPLLDPGNFVIATVDFDANGPPLHAHFARIHDNRTEMPNWYQFVPSSSHVLHSESDLTRNMHPNTNMMHIPEYSTAIIIWRSRTIMDHPMHLHGYKMEILKTFAANREKDCTLVKCELYHGFKTDELSSLPVGSRPIKDTFILPAGGAVATRIFTRGPSIWFAHCHMEVHRGDGMAFILNVGNFSAPLDSSWLPDDFPDCNTHFLKSHSHVKPNCDCYIDQDAVLETYLDSTYKCARPYLCMYQQSQVAVLTEGNGLAGFKISSRYNLPGWYITLIFVSVVAIVTLVMTEMLKGFVQRNPFLAKVGNYADVSIRSIKSFDMKPTFYQQFRGLVVIQWREYRPGVINALRVIEVCGLGVLAGILFMNVGVKESATGFGEKTSLLFFSTTLWSQTRMYPAIGNYFEWAMKDYLIVKHKQYDLLPVFLARMVVVIASEAWWPVIFILCAYPLADMFGDLLSVFTISVFLALNNSCYISLGALFGTVMPTVPLGMIGATLFAQTTVICAGFFTQLPQMFGWVRYISPIFWTFKGIVKTAYTHTDTYRCIKGQSSVGYNECFLEQNPLIDNYKNRGINVATFGDPSSEKIYLELAMLLILFTTLQVLKILYHSYRLSTKINQELFENNCIDQNDHDEEFDKKILNLNRRSLFIKVDDRTATKRMTMRQSLIIEKNVNIREHQDDFIDDVELIGFRRNSNTTNS